MEPTRLVKIKRVVVQDSNYIQLFIFTRGEFEGMPGWSVKFLFANKETRRETRQTH